MNIVILNIGLPAGFIEHSSLAAARAMRKLNMPFTQGRVHELPGCEPTLVVETSAPDNVIHDLSVDLGEDCIAVWDLLHREGRLVGPNTEPWGPFDPAKFILLNGSLLSEARSVS